MWDKGFYFLLFRHESVLKNSSNFINLLLRKSILSLYHFRYFDVSYQGMGNQRVLRVKWPPFLSPSSKLHRLTHFLPPDRSLTLQFERGLKPKL